MKRTIIALFGVITLALFNSPSGCAAENAPLPTPRNPPPQFHETDAEHRERMQWFRDAHFGMFIHWGLYSELAGEWKEKTSRSEWIQQRLNIPSSQYMPLAGTFNPVKFDADAWVRLMARAGVKYIAVTTKHHDGFCMWPTACNSDWNIGITPFKRDPIKELSEACARHGVRFGIYYSIPDWYQPDWPIRPKFNDHATGTPDKERYKYGYLFPQLKELLTNYGPVSLLWLDDGGMARPPIWNEKDGTELENYIRSIDRKTVLDDRSQAKPFTQLFGNGATVDAGPAARYANHAGDYITPEGVVPATGLPGVDWEACQTMQPPDTTGANWGYNRRAGFRSFVDLFRQMVEITSKGGNLLLNIGPDAEGEILPQARQCLEKFGDWMERNAESIHGTSASPFDRLPFYGRCTQKPGILYMHVFGWPAAGKLLVPVSNKVKKAYLLADAGRAALNVESSASGATISLPAQAPDPVDTVVALEIEGEPQVTALPKNLALGKTVEVSSSSPGPKNEFRPEFITDGKVETFWSAEEKARSAWVVLDLRNDTEVKEAVLYEAPQDRIQSFDLEAKVDGQWKKIAAGQAIGPELHLTFTPVKARLFRLNIRKAADTPTLAEIQLY